MPETTRPVSPQGYVITVNPTNQNPFWDKTPPPVPAGEGIPKGGKTGQVLTKKSDADYDAGWEPPTGGSADLPAGADGDILYHANGEWAAADPQVAIPEINDLAADISALQADTAILKNGGTAGQVLTKDTDGSNAWKTPDAGWTPPAGTQDQILAYDAAGELQAVDVGFIPDGGTDGQVLTKNGAADFDVKWSDPTGGYMAPYKISYLTGMPSGSSISILLPIDLFEGEVKKIKLTAVVYFTSVSGNSVVDLPVLSISSGTVYSQPMFGGTLCVNTIFEGSGMWSIYVDLNGANSPVVSRLSLTLSEYGG